MRNSPSPLEVGKNLPTGDQSMPTPDFTHSFLQANGIRIHAVTCGETNSGGDQTPFLLLHGFPEFWYSWRYIMPLLAAPLEGPMHKVVAVDLRGYKDRKSTRLNSSHV